MRSEPLQTVSEEKDFDIIVTNDLKYMKLCTLQARKLT